MALKGKEVAGKASSGKRKRGDSDKSGKGRKRKNTGVLQFFEDVALEADDNDASDDSDFEDDFFDELGAEPKVKNEPGKAHNLPFLPKEEELSDGELERILEDRYKDGSRVTYAEDEYETKRSIERNSLMPSAKDPTIWKVKCMVGRERQSAFCLMQKYVELQSLGTKLQIISAFAVEHIKGFIYIEADKQFDINEACKGLCNIYSSRVTPVPKNEVSHLLSVRSKYGEVSEGTWARVKSGKYKGDLAQVAAVNDGRKKATVKLIPRIDLQAMNAKFGGGVTAKKTGGLKYIVQGGGVTAKKTDTPAPRLISSSELEEFRPLIQYRRDRDTGKVFEILDGLMLKDGYLYKKVSIDSLTCCGVMPSEDELQKFKPSKSDESDDLEWLSQLYGEQKKKHTMRSDKGGGKGGGKGEGSSGSNMANSFEVHDLVLLGRKDFGVIVGMEKDDTYKILKEGAEGSVVVTVELHELKNAPFDKKFGALDQRMKNISVNDTVMVLEGPSKGRQGTVKQIYRGTLFLYDENELENSGYFCSKSQMCKKIKLSDVACNEKGGESGPPGFEDFMSSPKSPLSPKKPWQSRENNREFSRGDKDGMFSIGQTLRIRVGPLKGYLCRVLALRHSDVTVKLDSQQKILTVKCEHLSEVRGKSSVISMGEDPESLKPFDLLGTEGCSKDWMDGAGTSAETDRWNAGGLSTERSSWPDFPSSGISLQPESNSANPFGSVDNDPKKDVGDAAWESKATSNQNSSWGTGVADNKAVANSDQVGGWGKSEDCWNKGTAKTGFGSSASDSWEKAKLPSGDQAGSSKDAGDNWGKGKLKIGSPADSSNAAVASWEKNKIASNNQEDHWNKSEDPWDKGKNVIANPTSSWNNAIAGKNQLDSCSKGKDGVEGDGSTWGKTSESQDKGTGKGIQEDSWGKAAEKWCSKDGSSGSKADWKSSTATPENQARGSGNAGRTWAQPAAENTGQASGWRKAKGVNGGQTEDWGNVKNVGEDATGFRKGGFGNQDQAGSWTKPKASGADGGSSWNKQDGESSWNKQAGGSSWNKQAGVNTEDESRGRRDQNDSWDRPKSSGEGFSDWNRGRMGNKDDTNQQDSWEGPKTFDGGRGSGGRRGREGGRGGRDQFGRGRSFGRGQSSGWNKEGQENNWTGDGTSSGNASGWSSDQAGGWGKTKVFDGGRKDGGWNKPDVSCEDNGSSWNKGWDGGKEKGESGDKWNSAKPFGGFKSSGDSDRAECQDGAKSFTGNQSSGWHNGGGNWNASKPSDGNGSSGWNKGSVTNEESSGNRGHGNSWNTGKASIGDQATGWKSGTGDASGNQSDWNNKSSDGSNPKASNNDQSSGWNKKFTANEEAAGAGDNGGDWNKRKAPGEYQNTGWKSKANDADGNQSSGWGNKSNQGTGWKSGTGAGGNQDSGWGNKSNWNSGNAFGGDESVAGGIENRTDTFGNRGRGGNWRGGKSFGDGQSSGWVRGKFADNEAGDSAAFPNQSHGFGRGGGGVSDRGGFGGRGGSDRGGFGGRGGPNRGGFGGRGGPNRGGFGGRGYGRRDQSGGWNSRNDSGEDKPFSWNKRAEDSSEGCKSNDGAVSWNQGGGDKGQWQSWNSGSGSIKGTGGTSNQAGGWDSQRSGWNQPTGAKETGGSNAQDGGWNKGTGSTNEAGGSNDQGNTWKPSNASGGAQLSGWNQLTGAKETGGSNAQDGGWNKGTGSTNEAGGSKDQGNNWKPSNASGGAQWSGGSQPTVTKEAKGTHDQNSGWNLTDGSSKGTGGTSNQAGGWNSRGSGGNQLKEVVESAQAGGWNKGTCSAKDAGRSDAVASSWSSQASAWNKAAAQTNEAGGSKEQGNNWKPSNASAGGESSGWKQSTVTKEASRTRDQVGGWNKGPGSSAQAGVQDNQESGRNRGTGSGNGGATGDRAETWNRSNAADGAQSSGLNQVKNAKEGTSGGGEPADSWGKAAASSWGKGSSKGGW